MPLVCVFFVLRGLLPVRPLLPWLHKFVAVKLCNCRVDESVAVVLLVICLQSSSEYYTLTLS